MGDKTAQQPMKWSEALVKGFDPLRGKFGEATQNYFAREAEASSNLEKFQQGHEEFKNSDFYAQYKNAQNTYQKNQLLKEELQKLEKTFSEQQEKLIALQNKPDKTPAEKDALIALKEMNDALAERLEELKGDTKTIEEKAAELEEKKQELQAQEGGNKKNESESADPTKPNKDAQEKMDESSKQELNNDISEQTAEVDKLNASVSEQIEGIQSQLAEASRLRVISNNMPQEPTAPVDIDGDGKIDSEEAQSAADDTNDDGVPDAQQGRLGQIRNIIRQRDSVNENDLNQLRASLSDQYDPRDAVINEVLDQFSLTPEAKANLRGVLKREILDPRKVIPILVESAVNSKFVYGLAKNKKLPIDPATRTVLVAIAAGLFLLEKVYKYKYPLALLASAVCIFLFLMMATFQDIGSVFSNRIDKPVEVLGVALPYTNGFELAADAVLIEACQNIGIDLADALMNQEDPSAIPPEAYECIGKLYVEAAQCDLAQTDVAAAVEDTGGNELGRLLACQYLFKDLIRNNTSAGDGGI